MTPADRQQRAHAAWVAWCDAFEAFDALIQTGGVDASERRGRGGHGQLRGPALERVQAAWEDLRGKWRAYVEASK